MGTDPQLHGHGIELRKTAKANCRKVMNSSGKVITVFLVIIAFLLISLTLISVFLYQKESEKRKATEVAFQKIRDIAAVTEEELKKTKKENFLLQEKSKEADEKVNDLSDELELEKGLREEIKIENASLKDNLDRLTKNNDELNQKLTGIEVEKQRQIDELVDKLKQESDARAELENRNKDLEGRLAKFPQDAEAVASLQALTAPTIPPTSENPPAQTPDPAVNLDKIVVMPSSSPDGRILTVDSLTDFVIVNLGTKDGVKNGSVLSVYRGKDYLGDIKVTSVQPEMSAADLIPPFSSREVRKNDQVVWKNDSRS